MADNNNGAFIWSIANLLRGVYKQSDYGKIVLPFTILRHLDAVLAPTKDAVLAEHEKHKDGSIPVEKILPAISKHAFYNTSLYTVEKLSGDPANVRANLLNYIEGFSALENLRGVHRLRAWVMAGFTRAGFFARARVSSWRVGAGICLVRVAGLMHLNSAFNRMIGP